MKKILTLLFALMLTHGVKAQNDVTTFLGIPVDGFKTEMIKKLKAKGFIPVPGEDCLKGEFNGTNVLVYIITNNNKVYRIMLCDEISQDEGNIKIRFNKLVSQFEHNKRYTTLDNYTLSDEENISYEMTVNNKNYDAVFYQNPIKEKMDSTAIRNEVQEELLSKYTKEQLDNPTEDIKSDIQSTSINIFTKYLVKKPVWFRIIRDLVSYRIIMYYDNEYNHANGEDL